MRTIFFDTHGVTPAQLLADRALELAQRTERGRPSAWHTALFASQHELFTYRNQSADDTAVMGDRAGRVRAVAQWLLPYGIQRQLRQARAGATPYASRRMKLRWQGRP